METQYLLRAFEKTVEDLADDFQRNGAFSFTSEVDVQAALFGRLRADLRKLIESNCEHGIAGVE